MTHYRFVKNWNTNLLDFLKSTANKMKTYDNWQTPLGKSDTNQSLIYKNKAF